MGAVEQVAAGPAQVPDMISSIGCDMSIVGKIFCDGPVQVFGRIAGELCGADLLIGDGAQVVGELRGASLVIGAGARVEGNIFAQEVTVLGRVRGTIRALHVKLLGRAAVEGDIFHQQLSIEEEALFEGSSRPPGCG
jgi:cytoskeletal protein CcmA (bactofilin family)